MPTIDEIKSALRLQPHPNEGGFYAETYRSAEEIAGNSLPSRYHGKRSFGTAIYYLLTPETFSGMHRLPTDEIFHFYLGDVVEMLLLRPDGTGKVLTLGTAILGGESPQVVVPRGVWQGSRLAEGGRFALLGTTMAPGFEFSDYETGRRKELLNAFPAHADMIAALTRE
jgi:predicted cupin superfamily sugar epimerase